VQVVSMRKLNVEEAFKRALRHNVPLAGGDDGLKSAEEFSSGAPRPK
jgi:hypothetical protein